MMFAIIAVAAVVLASLPVLLRRAGRRLPPAEWTILCVVALAGAVVLVELALLLVAAPVALSIMGLHSLAAVCDEMLGSLAAIGHWLGPVAAAAALVLPAAVVHQWRRISGRSAELWIEPGLGRHEYSDELELVVLPTDAAIAYCVARPRPQVVVSEGLVRQLPPDQLDAVLAHERAHLARRHPALLRLVATAATVLAWWPPARSSDRVARAAIERWADDVAVNGDHRRRGALLSALLGLALVEAPSGVPAFSPAEATAGRVEALAGHGATGATTRLGMYLPGALLGTTVAATLLSCVAAIPPALAFIRECCSF